MLTRKQTQWYTRKVYRFLKQNNDIRLKKLRINRGTISEYSDGSGSEITLDFRDPIIPTLIHEILHDIHPKWSENKILAMETKLVNSLSERQLKYIIKLFAYSL